MKRLNKTKKNRMSEVFEQEVGYLHLGVGGMFSGKSTWLRRETTTLTDVGFDCLIINYKGDNRDTVKKVRGLTTHHSSGSLSEKIDTIRTKILSKVNIDNYQVIGIDEAQFYPDLEKTVREWVTKNRKIVYVAGLVGDSDMKSFGQIKDLLCFCDDITKFKAKCMECMLKRQKPYRRVDLVPASFTMLRTGKSKNGQEQIGGSDMYIAVCRKCHKMTK